MLTTDLEILDKTSPSLGWQLFKTAVLVVVIIAFVSGTMRLLT